MSGNLQLANNLNATTKPQINNIDKLVFLMCVMDILFLPYIRVVSASISMIVLPIWYIFNLKKIKLTSEFKLFLLLASLVVLSVALSTSAYPMLLKSNITNSAILIYGFLYYFFYKYYFESNSNTSLKKLLSWYVLFGFTLATVYLVSPNLYFQVRSFWSMSGEVIEITDSLVIHRFTSTFSDPNNAAVVFVSVMAFLLLSKKTSFLKSILLMGATALILIAAMSSTGFILFGLTILFYFAWLLFTKKFTRFKKSTLLYMAIIFFLLPFILVFIYIFLGSDVAQMSLERVAGNSADSRFLIWKELLSRESIFSYILYGMGGTVVIDGYIFKPHNGHLHLIYSYGMIVYAIFISIFFRKRKNTSLSSYFFLVPFFLGFTMNVGIYEPRFMFILALLLASYATTNKGRKAL